MLAATMSFAIVAGTLSTTFCKKHLGFHLFKACCDAEQKLTKADEHACCTSEQSEQSETITKLDVPCCTSNKLEQKTLYITNAVDKKIEPLSFTIAETLFSTHSSITYREIRNTGPPPEYTAETSLPFYIRYNSFLC